MTYSKWKMKKSNFNAEEYSAVAEWCNENQTHTIEEQGEYYAVVEIKPYTPTNEEISEMRQLAYTERTDPLTLRKMRKQALGEWTSDDEAEYIAQIKAITEAINSEFPYNSEEPKL